MFYHNAEAGRPNRASAAAQAGHLARGSLEFALEASVFRREYLGGDPSPGFLAKNSPDERARRSTNERPDGASGGDAIGACQAMPARLRV